MLCGTQCLLCVPPDRRDQSFSNNGEYFSSTILYQPQSKFELLWVKSHEIRLISRMSSESPEENSGLLHHSLNFHYWFRLYLGNQWPNAAEHGLKRCVLSRAQTRSPDRVSIPLWWTAIRFLITRPRVRHPKFHQKGFLETPNPIGFERRWLDSSFRDVHWLG